jgi:electron transfer flavoprotein alpha subunit
MILVIAEQKEGRLNRATWEAVAAAQSMGGPVKIAVIGASVGAVADDLASAEVTEVVAAEHPALAAYTADGFVQALAALVQADAPAHVVLPHTYQTRDFAPALAARLDRALATDCTAVRKHDAALAFSRPMFQGKVSADVVLEGPAPHLVTFQIGAFRADAAKRGSARAPVRHLEAAVDAAAIRQKPESPFREAKQAVDLTQA